MARLSAARRRPKILTVHNMIKDDLFSHRHERSFVKKFIGQNRHITCVSRDTFKSLNAAIRLASPPAVIPNGILLREPGKPVTRKKNQILFAGRLSPEKGIDILLEAVRLTSEASVLIAGNGPAYEKYKRVADGNKVTFLGNLDNEAVMQLMRQSTLIVLPSRFEGMPLVMLEAMSCRCPVIASRVGGIPEVIVDHKTGLLVAPENPKELSTAITKLLEDENLRHRLAENAFELVNRKYACEQSSEQYLQLYRKILYAGKSSDAGPPDEI